MPLVTTLSFCFASPNLLFERIRASTPPAITSPLCTLHAHAYDKKSAAAAATAAALAAVLFSTPTSAKTVLSTNTILRRYVATDSAAILRYALPLPSERVLGASPLPIRRAQELLERLGVDLRARGAAGIIGGRRDLAKLKTLLVNEQLDILLDVPAKKRLAAAELLSNLERAEGEIERELGVTQRTGLSSIFPPQMMAVADALQEVVERRNSISRRTNFDGTVRVNAYFVVINEDEVL